MQMHKSMWKVRQRTKPNLYLYKEWLSLYVTLVYMRTTQSRSLPYPVHVAWKVLKSLSYLKLGWSSSGSKFQTTLRQDPTLVFNYNRLDPQCLPTTNLKIRNQQSTWLKESFLLNWQLSRPKGTYDYVTHRDFRLLFVHPNLDVPYSPLVSSKRYFLRWVDSYNLLYNLFYANASVQMLSNKLFIEESLTFNWENNVFGYKLFKYTQPWFIFKDVSHGSYVHSAIKQLKKFNTDFILLIDMHNHLKILPYLQRYNFYIVGLVPINRSPWKVSYPIPTFADSNLSQFYFLRWLFLIKSQARTAKFSFIRDLWSIR